MNKFFSCSLLSLLAATLASCGHPAAGETLAADVFAIEEQGTFDDPWALAFEPGTGRLFVTEKAGTIKFLAPSGGKVGTVSGAPKVDYGGQGGLGEIAFAPDYATNHRIYLSWAEAGTDNTRGAAVGRGTLVCALPDNCAITEFEVIWRQSPKVTGRGHYSHRLAFSPDGKYLFIASGDRQKMEPAQDTGNNLGSIVRLNLDGTSAAGNPFAGETGKAQDIWSYGHRNILGLEFDAQGRLWEVENGPRGGDELNLVERGANYGWPIVSDGVHYDGTPIPPHATRPDLPAPKLGWTPVIAPSGMTFVTSDRFPGWKGDLLISGMSSRALVRVSFDGANAREAARYPMGMGLRAVAEGPDGAIWLLEKGGGGRLLKLTPK